MMKTCGVITEYNPFHQGHIHHLRQARALSGCDCLVCIVSDYFSQRGLPSLMSWREKTRLALENGADLVIRLPSVYAAQSADHFARYALESLSVLGVDQIVFGSESDDPEKLEALSLLEAVPDPSTSQARHLQALPPNDILGVQYIRQCRRLGIGWQTIPRVECFKSATATRAGYFAGEPQDFDGGFLKEERWESYYPALRTALLMTDPARLAEFFLVTEGIEHRLAAAARAHRDWPGFLEAAVSRTYSRARIQRTCLMILLQVEKAEMARHDSFFYVIPAGFNETGRALLRSVKDPAVCMKFSQLPPFLKKVEEKTSLLYDSVLPVPCKKGLIYEKE